MILIEVEFFNSLYSIISNPLGQEEKKFVSYGKLLLVWITSVIFAVVHQLSNFTAFGFMIQFITAAGLQAFLIVTPAILLIVVYCMAGIALKASKLKHENTRAMELRKKQNSTVLQMFAIITICFFMLTLPFIIWLFYSTYLIVNYPRSLRLDIIIFLGSIFRALFFANVSIKPIIYAKMHREVNRYLRRLMQKFKRACWQCCTNRNQDALLQ